MPVYSVICVYVCKDTALIMIVILLSVIDNDKADDNDNLYKSWLTINNKVLS